MQDPVRDDFWSKAGVAAANEQEPGGFDWAAAGTLAGKEAQGLDFAAQWLSRAGSSMGDAAVRGVDAISTGLLKIGQLGQAALQQVGIGEGPSIEAKGPFERMTGRVGPELVDVFGAMGLTDPDQRPNENLGDYARRMWSEKLGPDAYMTASIAGELAGIMAPGSPLTLVGKGAAQTAAAMAGPVQRFYARKILEGRMHPGIVRNLAESGQLLTEMARQGGWQSQLVQHTPGLVGEYSALLSQMYAMAPRGEGAAAVEHAAIPAIGFLALGRGGKYLGERYLDKALSNDAKAKLLTVYGAMQHGVAGKGQAFWDAFKAMRPMDKLHSTLATGGQTALEALGFTMLDKQAVTDLYDGFAGNPDAISRLVARFKGNLYGILVGKFAMPLDAAPYFRRLRPDLNSWSTERVRQQAEQELQQAQERQELGGERFQGLPQEAKTPTPAQERAENARQRFDVLPEEAARAQGQDAAVQPFVDPLLRSGFRIESASMDKPTPEIVLRAPGGGTVLVRVAADGRPSLAVDAKVYQLVRGGEIAPGEVVGDKVVIYEPAHARDFLTDLGLRSSVQQMRNTMRLGRMGFYETEAGGPWRDVATGNDYTFGLDGDLMRREVGGEKWEKVAPDDPIQAVATSPPTDTLGEPSYWSPGLARWAEFQRQKARDFPDQQFDEALHLAIGTAQYGRDAASAQELRKFFDSVDPGEVAGILSPLNSRVVAHTIASMGGGLSNAQVGAQTLMRLSPSVASPGETRLLQAPTPDQADMVVTPGEPGAMPKQPVAGEIEVTAELPDPLTPAQAAQQQARGKKKPPPEDVASAAPETPTPAQPAGAPMVPEPVRWTYIRPEGDNVVLLGPNNKFKTFKRTSPEAQEAMQATRNGATLSDVLGVPVGREGEAGVFRAPDIRGAMGKLVELAKGTGSLPSKYSELLPARVARLSKTEGKKFARGSRATLSRARTLQAEVEPERFAAEQAVTRPAQEFLEGLVSTGPGGSLVTRYNRLIHDRLAESEVPEGLRSDVARVRETHQALIRKLGSQAQRAGVLQLRRGEYQPFQTGTRGILPRVAGEDLFKVMDDPALRQAYAEAVAAHPENQTTVEHVLSVLAPKAQKLDAFQREAQFEEARQWQTVPDVLEVGGRQYRVWESRPQEAPNRLAREQTGRTAVVEQFGQNLPESVRVARGLKEGLQPLLDRVRREMREEDFASADVLAKRISGIGTESLGVLENVANVEGLLRAVQTWSAAIYDVADPVMTLPGYFGYTKFFREVLPHLNPASESFKAALQDALRHGSVMRDMGEWALFEAGKPSAALRDIFTSINRGTEKWKQVAADLYIKSVIKDLRAGKASKTDQLGLELLGFEPSDVQALMTGKASDALYTQLRHEFVQQATNNFRPGEGSLLHQSRRFNFWFAYNRFFMGRMGQVAKRVLALRKEGQRTEAAKSLSSLLVGATFSGLFSKWLSYLLSGQGTEEYLHDLLDAPAVFTLKATGAQLAGGLVAQMVSTLTSQQDLQDAAVRVIHPARPFVEAWDWMHGRHAYMGQGPAEGAFTFTQRVGARSLVDTAKAAAAMAGIGETTETQDAVARAQRWPGRPRGVEPSPKNPELWATMRNAAQAVQAGEDPRPLLEEGLQLAPGESIARSLRGRRMTDGLDSDQLEALGDWMGPEGMARLYSYDNMLDALADEYGKKAGTPEPVAPFQQELQRALEQVRLGSQTAWGDLREQAVSGMAERLRAGSRDISEIRSLAQAMSLFPESLTNVLTERQQEMLRRAGRSRAQRFLEGILLESARTRAQTQQRKAVREKRKRP